MLLPRKSVLFAPSSKKVSDAEGGPLTADRERIAGAIIWIGAKNAGLEEAKLQRVAIGQRKIVDHALILDFSEDGAGGVHLNYVGRDLDGLIFLADFQRDVLAAVLIQLEYDSVLEKVRETGLIHGELVGADPY